MIKKGGTGQQAKQGRRQQQLRTGEGAGRRLHPPSSRHGSRQGPSSFLVLLAAREGSSAARSVRCRGATHPPAHLCVRAAQHEAAEPVFKGGPASQP